MAPGPVLGDGGAGGKALIPGTDVVADVAAEDPPVEFLLELAGNRPLLLDGEIGDAPGGVENPGLHEGRRGAGIEAAGTGAAVVGGERRIRRELEVGEDRPDEEPRSGAGPDEHGVL